MEIVRWLDMVAGGTCKSRILEAETELLKVQDQPDLCFLF